MRIQIEINYIDLARRYTIYDGFIFTALTEPANVYDAIVIRNPETVDCFGPHYGISTHSLAEHIQYVNENQIEKAIIIAEDIAFITRCSCLSYLRVIPADSAAGGFDYSPLYQMPQIKYFTCNTVYGGLQERRQTSIDYSKINGIQELNVEIEKGDSNYDKGETLKRLSVSNFKGSSPSSLFCSELLEELDVVQSSLKSLDGIDRSKNISSVSLYYNRSLTDISELEKISDSLQELVIEYSPKITDFSCLQKLINLKYLTLTGSNDLRDLSFLKAMPKLKVFSFSMNVLDGDLTPCLNVPYVDCAKNRKHYNLKDKDLPKILPKSH